MISNLEYYKVFYYVGKHNSITAAAKELSISQPAVSQSIHQLESILGCTLFQRTSKGMKLTSEGSLLYRYVEKGYEQIDLGEQRLSHLLHLDAGEVRIGASDMTLRFFLLPYLEKFHELYPGIKVTVTNGPTPETLSYLKEDRIDFGVVSSPFEESDTLSFFPVSEIQDTFVAVFDISEQFLACILQTGSEQIDCIIDYQEAIVIVLADVHCDRRILRIVPLHVQLLLG